MKLRISENDKDQLKGTYYDTSNSKLPLRMENFSRNAPVCENASIRRYVCCDPSHAMAECQKTSCLQSALTPMLFAASTY